MSIVTLNTKAKICRQFKCPTMNKWMKKSGMYTMEYLLL